MPLVHMNLPYVGPKPKGDVGAMKEMAAACATASAEISEAVGQAKNAIGGMGFHGPAANKLTAAVGGQLGTQEALARSLSRFAKDLAVAADELADDLRAYKARQEAREEAEAYNRQVDRDLAAKPPKGLGVPSIFPTS